MTSRDFCYWLQGYFEIEGGAPSSLDHEQLECIRRHLAMVFIHEIDPGFPKDQKAALDAAHVGKVAQTLVGDPPTKPFDPHTDSTTVPPHSHGYVEPPVFRC